MAEASLARFAFIVGAMGALLAGCAQPNPDTAAGRSEIAGQKCTLCIVQGPTTATSPGSVTTQYNAVFMEQQAHGLEVWMQTLVPLRAPKLFNLRSDPFERAEQEAGGYDR
jgi:hypothetical protein